MLLVLALLLFWSTCHPKDISSEFKEEEEEELKGRNERMDTEASVRIRAIDVDCK